MHNHLNFWGQQDFFQQDVPYAHPDYIHSIKNTVKYNYNLK